jgi:hypothetical protein
LQRAIAKAAADSGAGVIDADTFVRLLFWE